MESKQQEWKAKLIYIVDIQIIKGIELQTTECDAYIKIECGNNEFTTNTQNTSNPQWNEKTQFIFYKQPHNALLSVLESNKHAPIGKHTLQLTDCFHSEHLGKTHQQCIELEASNYKRGEVEIKVKCSILNPFTMEERSTICKEKLEKGEEQIARCDAQITNCYETHTTLQSDITSYEAERKGLHDECNTKRDELSQCEIEGEKCDAEMKDIEADCDGYDVEYAILKKQKRNVTDRMRDYAQNLSKMESEDEDEMDIDLCRDIVSEYRRADRKSKQNDIKKAKYRAVGKTEEYDDEHRQYNENKEKADTCLNEMNKWKTQCDEEYQSQKEECLNNLDYSESDEKRWFSSFYVCLNKVCFNLQIVAATLDVFGEDIKRLTKKRISKCTIEDLGQKTEGKRASVWETLYGDHLDFVMLELQKVYPLIIRHKPMKNLCDKANTLMTERYNGYFPRFSKLIAHWLLQLMLDANIGANSKLLDDAICAVILLLNDKKGFCIALHRSMKEAEEAEDKEEDDSDDIDDEKEDVATDIDRYERIVCSIIIAISRLWDSALVDELVDATVEKEIQKQLDDVLEHCAQLQIDNKSQLLIERFFGYFFRPKTGTVCCGGDTEEGTGWIGRVFGSLCQK